MFALQVLAICVFLAAGALQFAMSRTQPSRRRPAGMFLMFGLALGFDQDGVYRRFDQLAHRPNLADLLSHLAGLIGIHLFWTMLRSVVVEETSLRRRRVQTFVLVTVLSATVVSFAAVRAPIEDPAFSARYGNQAAEKAYWALSALYAMTCLVQLGATVATPARASAQRDVSRGMLLAAWGGIGFGTAYILLKILQISAVGADDSLAHGSERVQTYVLAPGMVCLAVGLFWPLARRGTRTSLENLRVRKHLLALRPLHKRLSDAGAIGQDDLLSSSATAWADATGPVTRERLLRRVVETQDALLLIRTRIADAEGDAGRFPDGNGALGNMDFAEATLLCKLAAGGEPALPGPGGMRKIDIFEEAQALADLGRQWRNLHAATSPA